MSKWMQHCDYCDMKVWGADRDECVRLRQEHEAACKKEREALEAEEARQAYLKRTGRKAMTP